MLKRLAIIGTFALLLAAFAAPAQAQVRVGIQIGAPVHRARVAPVIVAPVVAPAPYPGYVWQPAHYVWGAYGYQLVPAMWVPAPYFAPQYVVAPRPQPRGLALGLRYRSSHGRRW